MERYVDKPIEEYIAEAIEEFPEFLTSEDLINLGIYISVNAAYQARVDGSSPKYIKLKHKILYPKKALIEFLQSRA